MTDSPLSASPAEDAGPTLDAILNLLNRYGMACCDHGATTDGTAASLDAMNRRHTLWMSMQATLAPLFRDDLRRPASGPTPTPHDAPAFDVHCEDCCDPVTPCRVHRDPRGRSPAPPSSSLGAATATMQEHTQHLESRSARDATRCESVTGGGRYQCCLATGHAGRHRADAGFTSWSDE